MFWSLWKEMSSKIFILLVSEILRLFVNILTPDEKYSVSVKTTVSPNQFKCNYLKSKNIFWIFFFISKTYIKFWILWKKRWAAEIICFRKYRLQKASLMKCLKNPVSEHLWAVNMLKAPKHCLNLHCSTFVKCSHNSERKWARKILS